MSLDASIITEGALEDALHDALVANEPVADTLLDVLGMDGEIMSGDDLAENVRRISDSGWLTDDRGVELTLGDGSVWLVTVQRVR